MLAAAANLTPVTLELGGKSPAIVAPDYPVAAAARSIAFGKFVNAGQTCIAPDYALVPAQQLEAFAEAVLQQARRTLPDPGRNPDYSAIVSPAHRARLHALLDEARASGARVLSSAELPRDDPHVAPTVVLAPGRHLRLMQEEIFGPILPIVPYQNLDEALALVARHERPLALYLFSHQRSTRQQVLAAAPSGGVTLNGTLFAHCPAQPAIWRHRPQRHRCVPRPCRLFALQPCPRCAPGGAHQPLRNPGAPLGAPGTLDGALAAGCVDGYQRVQRQIPRHIPLTYQWTTGWRACRTGLPGVQHGGRHGAALGPH